MDGRERILETAYEKLLSKMFQLNAGYFLIQCASEEDRKSVYRMCGEYSRDVKPKHGSPDFARDIAMRKIAARLEGARLASEVLTTANV